MRTKTLIAPALAVVIAAACTQDGPTGVESPESAVGPVAEVAGAPTSDAVVQEFSVVQEFPDGPVIPGASARLMRTADGVNLWFQTNGLTQGNVYSLWAIIFNHPENCIVPNACGLADVMANDPAVGVEGINGGALVAGGSGKATFAGRVRVGETGIFGVGLLDAFDPTIHLAIRHHGPKVPGTAQFSEFNGGCDGACPNVQAAFQF